MPVVIFIVVFEKQVSELTPQEYLSFLEAFILQIMQEKETLEKKNEELKKRLLLYENPHTPPSIEKRANKRKVISSSKKRGAPKGHRGATRQKPEPDDTVQVSVKVCPGCSHELGTPVSTETHIIEDLLPPQKAKVTQYELDVYNCPNCGMTVKARHRDCPKKGNFGIFLLVYVTMLKYHMRGVLRRIQDFLLKCNSFEISVKGIHDILLRVGDACQSDYGTLIQRIRNAEYVYMDETGFKVNGEKYWLWIFRTETDILVVIRKSRARKVLKEILGEDWDKPSVADGWSAYSHLSKLQRCWAHLIREVDEFEDKSKHGKRLSEEIHARFKALKAFLDEDPPMNERVRQKETFEKELEDIVCRYGKFDELRKPTTYIKNGLGNWYTCLLYPGMEPTNNLGEQAMREHVIMRKIIGCFRSENGAENYQYIASLLASWKLQGKNGFEELEGLLRRELCLS